ncbi:hypothetical protein [Helicobacter suis]|uniref:hypothetical protein n=1 Tax=Helicobacter suis TaxID=104628 RepID=UPI0013D234B4|nr:hypothetical protein [Helicobacter suis]
MSRHIRLEKQLYDQLCASTPKEAKKLLSGKELYIPKNGTLAKVKAFLAEFTGQNGLSLCVRLNMNEQQYKRALKVYRLKKTSRKQKQAHLS